MMPSNINFRFGEMRLHLYSHTSYVVFTHSTNIFLLLPILAETPCQVPRYQHGGDRQPWSSSWQSAGCDMGHPCSTHRGFLSQHVRCALSSSSDPSCIHPEVSGLGVRRKGGKGRGNSVCLQQIGFPCIFQQSKDKKHVHDPPL